MIRRDFEIPKEKVADFCQRHRIRKLALFGSALREDFGPDSDIDVLIEFEPGAEVGLIKLAGMELELAELLGTTHRVDLRTPEDLSRHFRDDVMRSAEIQYAA
ncbi:nucleotidyltransferase family protein [Phycisphaerales bacterium AB-hyl4]|uniref:Nucleotidyltransferase family protein n=1 Tax=Natronomicrosphaera hydrolytica TaxID=3242702 RepID=A0ABV4U7P1_9BACT